MVSRRPRYLYFHLSILAWSCHTSFVGQVGTLQLAAVSVESSVIAGFYLGITGHLQLCRFVQYPSTIVFDLGRMVITTSRSSVFRLRHPSLWTERHCLASHEIAKHFESKLMARTTTQSYKTWSSDQRLLLLREGLSRSRAFAAKPEIEFAWYHAH
jgi:hypothetical protein